MRSYVMMRNKYNELKKWSEGVIQRNANKDFHEKYTWTIYSLIDIKVVYIITAAYISIVNLISSTASIEATDDKHSETEFQISSDRRGFVTEISDYVLWNCRPLSVSDYYYKFLYWMLLTGLIAGLSGFFVAKLIMLINIGFLSPEHGLTRLWHIAVFQKGRGRLLNTKKLDYEKVPVKVFAKVKLSPANICRTMIPICSLFFLVAGMFLAYLSYDVHPLACIRGQADMSIQYQDKGNKMGRVEINLSSGLINLQIAAGSVCIFLVFFILLPLACCFYCCSQCVIQDMKKEIKDGDFIQIERRSTIHEKP